MDIAEDITAEHLHAKADEYEEVARRYRAAAVALEDPETGQRKPARGRRKAQKASGATAGKLALNEGNILKVVTPEGVKRASIDERIRGTEAQILRRLKHLEGMGMLKRTGERRTTRWHRTDAAQDHPSVKD